MFNIIDRGGRPNIMTHIGRPYDKKTKTLTVKKDESVHAVEADLQRKLRVKFAVPQFHLTEKEGIHDIDSSINWLIHDLRARKIGGIYLPNTRWFAVSGSPSLLCFSTFVAAGAILVYSENGGGLNLYGFLLQGEENKGANLEPLVVQLAGLADVFK